MENNIFDTLPTTDIAAIAASPRGFAIILRVAVLREFKPCLASDGEPVTIILINTLMSLEMFVILIFDVVLLFKKGMINIISDMYWLIIVEIPAPDIPRLKPNINIGSIIILSIPPVVRPIIAKVALPSYLNMLLHTQDITIAGAARKMYFP